MKKILCVLSLILVVLLLASCAEKSTVNFEWGEKNTASENKDGEITHKEDAGGFDFGIKGDKKSGGMATDIAAELYDSEPSPMMPEEKAESDIYYEGGNGGQAQAGTLTAGEWRDNANFNDFLKLMNENDWYSFMSEWKLFPIRRTAVKVTDGQNAVKGVSVALIDGEGKTVWVSVTDHEGMAYLFIDITSKEASDGTYKIAYKKGDITGETDISTVSSDVINITIKPAVQEKKKLDLMFMIDTTGSMGDELSYLQAEMRDVILRVSNIYKDMEIRLSVNFYRDHGDEYTVRYFKFNSDIDDAVKNLCAQYSSGGGDYPEAVDEAFVNAVFDHQWENSATKLMFFVLDAPPHRDDERQGTRDNMLKCIESCSEQGIRVIPVASSGVDQETEYILRTTAVTTGGTYVFLTNDSGVGGDHLEASVGEYDVEKLNELMIRLITEYCK